MVHQSVLLATSEVHFPFSCRENYMRAIPLREDASQLAPSQQHALMHQLTIKKLSPSLKLYQVLRTHLVQNTVATVAATDRILRFDVGGLAALAADVLRAPSKPKHKM